MKLVTTDKGTGPKENPEQEAARLLEQKRREIIDGESRHPSVLKDEIVGGLLELFAKKLRGETGNDDLAA